MADSKQSGKLSTPLMILTFLAMAGFLYWLNVTSEPTEIAVAEEDPRSELPDAEPISPVQFADDPAEWEGQRVRLPNIRVDALLGTEAFWFNLADDDETPFLVRLNREWIEEEMQILPDDVITLTGTVHAMSDSVITAWEDAGVFGEEGQRETVRELEAFIDADQVEIHSARDEEEDPDEEPDEADEGTTGGD